MKLSIGNTELTVKNCYALRYQNGKLVLKIEVGQEAIGHDDLKALLKNNTGDIILTKDDESTETFSGFGYTVQILDRDDVYECELECTSESTYQIGRLKMKNEELEKAVTAHGKTITEQAKVISEQTEQVESLEESSAIQGSTIETILLEVIPSVVEAAIVEALSSFTGNKGLPVEEDIT